ncbi:MAG: zinc ribbon domain-containing protein [Proteobacteria bacterium]|nr:zinc ribbon domain-containing protein [Pseudomonadota bacterium]
MSCHHANPAGYLFCGSCGETLNPVRCRCGFVAAADEAFCGRCGASLAEIAKQEAKTTLDAEQRFDLEYLAQQAAQDNKFHETTHKVRETQDDIRKLLSARRKRF